MIDSDIIMARMVNGIMIVEDKWAVKQGIPNPTKNDTLLGGAYNILESACKRVNGTTYVRFRRYLNNKSRRLPTIRKGFNGRIWIVITIIFSNCYNIIGRKEIDVKNVDPIKIRIILKKLCKEYSECRQ